MAEALAPAGRPSSLARRSSRRLERLQRHVAAHPSTSDAERRGTIDCVIWLSVIALVAILGVIAVVVAGRDDALVEVYDDRPDATLPTGRPLTAEDLAAVRLSTAVRGYRMDEVDALLGRIQADLLARETSATVKVRPKAGAEMETRAETRVETQPEGKTDAESEAVEASTEVHPADRLSALAHSSNDQPLREDLDDSAGAASSSTSSGGATAAKPPPA